MCERIFNEIRRLNCEINFLMKSRGVIEELTLTKPPENWELFPNSKTDKWKFLEDFSNLTDTTACLYSAKKGSKLPAHKHPDQSVFLSVENPNGKILVITKTYEKELGYMESISFENGEEHLVIFEEDTILLCRWKPRFPEDQIKVVI